MVGSVSEVYARAQGRYQTPPHGDISLVTLASSTTVCLARSNTIDRKPPSRLRLSVQPHITPVVARLVLYNVLPEVTNSAVSCGSAGASPSSTPPTRPQCHSFPCSSNVADTQACRQMCLLSILELSTQEPSRSQIACRDGPPSPIFPLFHVQNGTRTFLYGIYANYVHKYNITFGPRPALEATRTAPEYRLLPCEYSFPLRDGPSAPLAGTSPQCPSWGSRPMCTNAASGPAMRQWAGS